MRRTPAGILAVSLLLMNAVPMLAGAPDSRGPQVTVRIWDVVQVGNETLNRAQAVVEAAFNPIGIRLTWLHCAVGDAPEDLACSAPVGSHDISLRILQRSKTGFPKTRHSTAGMAVPLTPAGGKGIIYVFFDRVMQVMESQRIPFSLVLGVVIAHEIGHLLLFGEPHAVEGIMRGKLTPRDWQLAAQVHLGFTDRQREIIMTGMEVRNSGQHTNSHNHLALPSVCD